VTTRPLLPATFREVELSLRAADALACARNCVRIVRDEKINTAVDFEAFFFRKLDNRRLGVEILKVMAKWPQGMIDLANFGRARWDLADQALRELILEYGHRNEPMPIPLHAYNLEITDPRYVFHRQRGKKKADNLLRGTGTSFERARAGYDAEFRKHLADEIINAIANASMRTWIGSLSRHSHKFPPRRSLMLNRASLI
jgi:hypothetical protein